MLDSAQDKNYCECGITPPDRMSCGVSSGLFVLQTCAYILLQLSVNLTFSSNLNRVDSCKNHGHLPDFLIQCRLAYLNGIRTKLPYLENLFSALHSCLAFKKNKYRIYANIMRTFFSQISPSKSGCALDSMAH